MQGGSYGDRPTTPVQTPAEIAKFKRDVLGFLSDKNGGAIRIDWQAFAAKWNNDVKETEDNLRNQLLVENAEEEKEAEDDDDAPANVSPRMSRRLLTNCTNRKRVQDLEHYWVQEDHQRKADDGTSPAEDEPAGTRAAGGLSGRRPGDPPTC